MYLVTCCLGSPVPSNFSTLQILNLGGNGIGVWTPNYPHCKDNHLSIRPCKRLIAYFPSFLSWNNFCNELLKFLVHLIIGLILFIPIFPYLLLLFFHHYGLLELTFLQLREASPIFSSTLFWSSIILAILFASAMSIGVTISSRGVMSTLVKRLLSLCQT